jgi:VCBS repeat-containing protein
MAVAVNSTLAKTTVKVATLTGAAKDDLLTGLVNEDSGGSVNLNVLGNDPGSARLWSLVQDISSLAPSAQFLSSTATATTKYGATITANDDGTIKYDASTLSASLQSLGEGEPAIDTFVYTIRMANGALSTASVSVVIAGVNDAPVIQSVEGAAINDTALVDTTGTITGSVVATDVDNGAVLSYALTSNSTSEYGSFSIDSVTGAWSFASNASAIDMLDADDSDSLNFIVVVTDEHGLTAGTTVTIQLNGANDTAEISGVAIGSIGEDDTGIVGGKLTAADRDHDQDGFMVPSSLSGVYGVFTFDATGAWTYDLTNSNSLVQALGAGQSMTDTLMVESFDGSADQTITVTIEGAAEANIDPPRDEDNADPIENFLANNGKFQSGHYVIYTFTSNDTLSYVGGLKPTPAGANWTVVGSDTVITFEQNGNGNIVDVILIGYDDFRADQLI